MATTFIFVCPNCKNKMRAAAEYIGQRGRCPACKALVEIKAPGDDPAATISRATSARAKPNAVGTDIPGWQPGLIGAVTTVLLYLFVFRPLGQNLLGQMFTNRGPVMYFETLLFCWGLALLVLKYISVKRQLSYAELELQLIPIEIGLQITSSNVDQFLNNLQTQSPATRFSILGRRITGALEHFKSRHNVSEVQTYLSSQGELDASAVDSGYSLVKAFIWAIPILGFIGTVMGLSTAVGGLESLGSSGDMVTELKGAMGQVTGGLATAFDTTLVALIMAIVLVFPMEALRRTEYRMLDRIEQFSNESLLRRMANEDGSAAAEEMPLVVRQALESAFQQHQRWLAQWQSQVALLGQTIGTQFEESAARLQEKLLTGEESRIKRLEDLSRLVEELFQKTCASTEIWQRQEAQAADKSQALVEATERLEKVLADKSPATPVNAVAAAPPAELLEQIIKLQHEIAELAKAVSAAASGMANESAYRTIVPATDQHPIGHDGRGRDGAESRGLFSLWRRRP